MKTGLVTFYQDQGREALLRAAAMERAVEALGSECEIIDYRASRDGGRPAPRGRDREERNRRFGQFEKERLRVSGHRFESLEELRSAELPYDLILAGGSWDLKQLPGGRLDPVLFGAFSACRKIAYAPTLGAAPIPGELEDQLRGYLEGFSHLSVRERRGQKTVAELTGREVPVVLDPVLLLTGEQWAAMAADPGLSGGYILCDCAGGAGVLAPYIRCLAEKTGLPVVRLGGVRQKTRPRAKCVPDAGPAEYLGLFRNAAYVCTDSYCGTVFSIQFRKPFFAAVTPGELAEPESSRTLRLLKWLGLEGRAVGKGDAAGLEDGIGWTAAEERLDAARRSSLDYLRSALAGEAYTGAPSPDRTAADAPPALAERIRCTGCGACVSGCPEDAAAMVRDKEGFAYPVVDPARCVRCGHCTAVCPILHTRGTKHLPAVFAAWNRDDAIRKDSASGGAFSALAEYVLEGGGIVYGAAFDGRQHLRHVACFRKEDLWRLRGSKYVQSDLGGTFREIRKALETRTVLFSGTPCQVDGLYRYLGCRPENLLTCDLVCYGVPSPGVWEDRVRSIEQRKGKGLQAVRFRNKVTGWKDSHFTTVYDDGSVDSAPLYHTEYGQAFSRALFLRPSCHRCAYTNLDRPGDFTLGDLWGLRPDEMPEQQEKGISLLLVNTAHGSHVFDRLPLARQAFPVERAIAGNSALASPTPPSPDRAAFFAAYALEPFDKVWKAFCALPPLPVRMAGRLLSPEVREKLRAKLNGRT